MASGTAAPNYHSTLTASTVDTVTFTTSWQVARVINVTGTSVIYFTVDGSTPTVAGANCRVLPAVAGFVDQAGLDSTATTPGSVKLISAGTPGYSIIGGE
jgi:hypothetical protein